MGYWIEWGVGEVEVGRRYEGVGEEGGVDVMLLGEVGWERKWGGSLKIDGECERRDLCMGFCLEIEWKGDIV